MSKTTYYVQSGYLHNYQTGALLRRATKSEEKASKAAARHDGGAGVITDADLSRPAAASGTRILGGRVVKS